MLYPTNGEYTDWASATFGTVSINPELSSGYGPAGYYGFEFPDDETLLQQLYTDNLPFALDAIEMARDPAAYRSPTTGLRAERMVLESGTTRLRVRVPAGVASSACCRRPAQPVTVSIDSAAGGRYSRRRVAGRQRGRPATITVTAGGERVDILGLLCQEGILGRIKRARKEHVFLWKTSDIRNDLSCHRPEKNSLLESLHRERKGRFKTGFGM